MSTKKQIFIVDDHELFRDGLKFFINRVDDIEVAGEAANGKEFLDSLEICLPDVVLMDISMPVMDGVTATRKALAKYPNLKIIALSTYGDERYYSEIVEAGVCGFVIKDAGKNEIEEAVKNVLEDKNFFSRELLQKIMSQKYNFQKGTGTDIILTNREKEILALICKGFSNNDISEQLFISPKTVNNHRTNLLKKTSTKNSANLVMFALKNKLIDI